MAGGTVFLHRVIIYGVSQSEIASYSESNIPGGLAVTSAKPGVLTVRLPNFQAKASCSLYDMRGKEMSRMEFPGSPMVLDTRFHPKGIYILKIRIPGQTFAKAVFAGQ